MHFSKSIIASIVLFGVYASKVAHAAGSEPQETKTEAPALTDDQKKQLGVTTLLFQALAHLKPLATSLKTYSETPEGKQADEATKAMLQLLSDPKLSAKKREELGTVVIRSGKHDLLIDTVEKAGEAAQKGTLFTLVNLGDTKDTKEEKLAEEIGNKIIENAQFAVVYGEKVAKWPATVVSSSELTDAETKKIDVDTNENKEAKKDELIKAAKTYELQKHAFNQGDAAVRIYKRKGVDATQLLTGQSGGLFRSIWFWVAVAIVLIVLIAVIGLVTRKRKPAL